MLDIIKNTSNKGWESHGRFRQDPLIDELSGSAALDEDICNVMIKKFGIEKLTFLKVNQSAPVIKNLVNEINSILSGEVLEQKSNEVILKILNIVSLVFGNKHIQKADYLYLCNLCSSIFKNHYGKNYETNKNQENPTLIFTIQSIIESLIFNKHFNRQALDDMNITLQEEVNILHSMLEGPWTDEFYNSVDFQDIENFNQSSPSFDLYKHGIPYLDQYYKGDELKHRLSRAYNFITGK